MHGVGHLAASAVKLGEAVRSNPITLFSPMVEFLAVRDFRPGASTNWDVLPGMPSAQCSSDPESVS